MINDGMFTSKTDLWATPKSFFEEVNKEFNFEVDVCALAENAKCEKYFTPEINGLEQDWTQFKSIWCNPPYGKEMHKWIEKAYYTYEQTNKQTLYFCYLQELILKFFTNLFITLLKLDL